eukprot:gene10479-14082_t
MTADSINTVDEKSSGYVMDRIDPKSFNWVEIRRSKERKIIKWDNDGTHPASGPVTSMAEKSVMSKLIRKGEYISGNLLSPERIDEILSVCDQVDMSLSQAKSLRKQLLVDKTIYSHSVLKRKFVSVYGRYYKLSDRYFEQIKKIELKNKSKQLKKEQGNILMELNIIDSNLTSTSTLNTSIIPCPNDIQHLSNVYDTPAVAIMRAIITEKVESIFANDQQLKDSRYKVIKDTVKFIIRKEPKYYDNPIYMDEYDKYQLEYAKEIDQLSYVDVDSEERNVSERWEYSLYNYLSSKGVSYMNETDMMKQSFSVTPDAVILDDLSINGSKVRWIDCKCFYGSAQSSNFLKQLHKQVDKYNTAFGGPGAIIYKLGFSEDLQKAMKKYDCLLLDKGPLIDGDESYYE